MALHERADLKKIAAAFGYGRLSFDYLKRFMEHYGHEYRIADVYKEEEEK